MIFLRSSRSQASRRYRRALVLICLGTTVSTPRHDKTTANSRNRCSYECRIWIVVRIDLLPATELVSPRPSRLVHMRYCLIRLRFILECRRRISTRIITRVVENLLLSKKMS